MRAMFLSKVLVLLSKNILYKRDFSREIKRSRQKSKRSHSRYFDASLILKTKTELQLKLNTSWKSKRKYFQRLRPVISRIATNKPCHTIEKIKQLEIHACQLKKINRKAKK